MRHHVASEKYYDCLQCAEQCRHANNNSDGSSNMGKNIGSGVVNRVRNNHRFLPSKAMLYSKETLSPSPDDIKRTRNARGNLARSLSRHQPTHLTPAKKRSSLARPVRVHDSSLQPRRLMAAEDEQLQDPCQEEDQSLRDQAKSCKNPWWWQEQQQRDQQPNTSSYVYREEEERVAEDGAGWPIRLRLEQMLELTLPQAKRKKKKKKKKKKTAVAAAAATMMLMKQQQRSKQTFKDTERLLKVLSINNVDQDNRYNIKRCSVM